MRPMPAPAPRRLPRHGPTDDPGGAALAALGTAVGAVVGGMLAGLAGYWYAAAFLAGREFAAIPVIVFGGFAGGIAGGALGCFAILALGRRRAASGTALRALAFLVMLAPVLLLGTPALRLDRFGQFLVAGLAAGGAGALARALTGERRVETTRPDRGDSRGGAAPR